MDRDKQVWLILDSRSFGGIETHVVQLARGLRKYQIAVEVIFLADYGDHPIFAQLRQHQITVRVLHYGLVSLISALHREKPRLIHTHGYKAGIFGRLARLLNATTIVSTFHAGESLNGKLALYDYVDRLSSGFSHALIAVSGPIKARLDHQCTVLDNFVSTKQQGFPGEQIAFVGRLSGEKGPDTFLQLSSYFGQRLFHVYGDGPMSAALKAQAGDNVIFHGHQSDMEQHWKNIGLLVIPSRQEGLPMAALEAMAHGIPVCAYNVGSLARLIDCHNGWLTKSGDFKGLRHAVSQWLSSSLKRKFNRSRHARKRIIVKFSDIAVMPLVIDCYNQALCKNNDHLGPFPRVNKEHNHALD